MSVATMFFFFNDTATTEIYTLSLHDALPIFGARVREEPIDHDLHVVADRRAHGADQRHVAAQPLGPGRSEEHTSELQSRQYLVCRLLLEKKKNHFSEHPILYLVCFVTLY